MSKMALNAFCDKTLRMSMRSKRVRGRDSPWVTSDIHKLMNKCDKLKKKACQLKDEKLMGEYRKIRNKGTSEIEKAKKKYYSDKLSELNITSRNTWTTLKSIIPKKVTHPSLSIRAVLLKLPMNLTRFLQNRSGK